MWVETLIISEYGFLVIPVYKYVWNMNMFIYDMGANIFSGIRCKPITPSSKQCIHHGESIHVNPTITQKGYHPHLLE